MKMILIKTDNTYEVIERETMPHYQEYYGLIKCETFEAVILNHSTAFYINGEGKFSDKPNELATQYWHKHLSYESEDFLAGNALLHGFDADSGEDIGLRDDQIKDFEDFAKDMA